MQTRVISILSCVCLFLHGCSPEKTKTPGQEKRVLVSSPGKEMFYGRDYFIDDQHSYIGFRIKYFGTSNVRGRFDRFRGTAFYDSGSHFLTAQIIINASSVNTGMKMRDSDIQKDSWLDTEHYPLIIFKSSSVAVGEAGFDLTGDLYLKNKRKSIVAHFGPPTKITKDWAGNDQVDFTGEFDVKRSEFGIAAGSKWDKIMENGFAQLSDDLKIELEIHARRPDYGRRKKMLPELDSVANVIMNRIDEGGFDAGVKLIKEIRSVDKEKPDAFTLGTVANILLFGKKYDEALQIFEMRSRFYPDEKEGMNPLAVCYLLKGDAEKAKENFNKVLKKDSTNTKALEYLRLLKE